MHSICVSDLYRGVQPWQVRSQWTLLDVFEAHRLLAYQAELRAEAEAKD